MTSSRNRGLSSARPLALRALLFLLPALLAGCLKFETTVRVEPDGSGTITERFLLGKDVVDMFASMAPEGEAFNVLDEAQLREEAKGYGPQVNFVSAEPLETEFGQGYLAHFSFADINQLALDTNAGRKIPDAEGMTEETDESEPELVRFTHSGGSPSTLLIHWPVEEPSGAEQESGEEGPAEAPGPEELEMMKAFLGGMRMTMHVEVAGEITETNATYREGSTVTLIDVSFDDLLADETALQAMAQQEPESLSALKQLVEQIPGLKFEVEPEIKVTFQ